MDGIQLGLVIFLIVWILFLLTSIVILIHQRASPAIKHRGLSLLCLSVATNGVLTSGYILREVDPGIYPCFLVLWVTSVGIPLWFLVMGARFLRLAFLYRYNQVRLMCAMNSMFNELETTKEAKGPLKMPFFRGLGITEDWYLRNREMMSCSTLLRYIGYLVVFHVALTLFIQIGSGQATTAGSIGCGFTWELIPRVGFHAFYVFIMLPALAFLVWGIEDSYWIKRELTVVMFIEGISFIVRTLALFMPDLQNLQLFFPETIWTLAALVLVHFNTVVIPIVNSYLNAGRTLGLNKSSFLQVLESPEMFARFKSFAVKDFSVENILFYEHYQRLSEIAYSHEESGSVLETGEPDPVTQEIERMYRLFFQSGARYELNITGATLREVKVELERGPPYFTKIYEKAQVEIMTVMYQHSYPRFLRNGDQ
ncbi:hypothetical protein K493DRAFT_352177 [Basidiobolus meristosporus CBS 931.73]|uniref:RGS domain-containing protein n=1 Tax=Basidiobolus meristosporus CBS 931.73 TaxID=1314790 RepID=A0A1Y1YA06_9FUNG|nr:hypothetical protein K493DRAFT_352177 [Basidiobolus meristosporus CBS 931.73]|eukprot:ORX94841.1 hypothetical protein K493DRAFT_352177 [Basidiobolus meristosporus CBS 931.73]